MSPVRGKFTLMVRYSEGKRLIFSWRSRRSAYQRPVARILYSTALSSPCRRLLRRSANPSNEERTSDSALRRASARRRLHCAASISSCCSRRLRLVSCSRSSWRSLRTISSVSLCIATSELTARPICANLRAGRSFSKLETSD